MHTGELSGTRVCLTGYTCSFPAMITDWRAKFNSDLPFFFVQLAAYPQGNNQYADIRLVASNLFHHLLYAESHHSSPHYGMRANAFTRWAQTAALALDNTGMGTAIDIGTIRHLAHRAVLAQAADEANLD